jgi:pheromone alpha factor receptor
VDEPEYSAELEGAEGDGCVGYYQWHFDVGAGYVSLSFLPSAVAINANFGVMAVVFAALEFFDWDHFEPGSMTQTSVILVLPLGTLVAQRLANPGWFDSNHHRAGESPNSTGATGSSSISHGGMSGATATSTVKRPLLWSARGSAGRDGVHRGGQSVVSTHIAAASDLSVSEKARSAHVEGDGMAVDRDLARIASGEQDLERGHGGVRVDYGIERTEERVPTGSS